ncbi:MAG: type I restriction-modification enzyme R subunit C-terminal domain-containing protein, partial [Bacteroidota bacterium]
LFLLDRIALQEQTADAFKEHLPNHSLYPPAPEDGKIPTDRRVYIFTYPTLLNLLQSKDNPFSPFFFDLIIVDESHRSIYNVYQDILRYFDGITLGLTATPTGVIDHNTFELFDCENGLPDFAYSLDQAVKDGYLCDYEVLRFRTKFLEQGIHQGTISLEDQKRLLLEGKDAEELNFEGKDLERIVTNKGTNTLIVREFMEECIKDSLAGTLPGKTIIFCMNIPHARRVKEIFDELYPQYAGEIAKVIVSNDPRVYGKTGLLAQFKRNDLPRIAISVGMLDTGVDIREVVNLVFAKPVFSYTRFWQMMGRGTRLLEPADQKPWCAQKDRFLIMDCWDNFDYFDVNPKGREPKQQIPLPVRLFRLRLDKLNLARELNESAIAAHEIKRLRSMISTLPKNSVGVAERREDLERVGEDAFWQTLGEARWTWLRDAIAPLLKYAPVEDTDAMLFEKDVTDAAVAWLAKDETRLEAAQAAIAEQVSRLPLSIAEVAKERALIEQVKTGAFWSKLSDAALTELAERLAPLMQHKQRFAPPLLELNLADSVAAKERITFGPERETVSIQSYRQMVEQKIHELTATNLVLRRLKRGEPVSEADLHHFARLLEDENPFITENLLRRVYDNRRAGFMQFICHILGLEVLLSYSEEVRRAFEAFVANHSQLSSGQIRFIEVLKDYLVERGKISRRDLVSAPFTNLHKDGILGIFTPKQVEEIVRLSERLAAA